MDVIVFGLLALLDHEPLEFLDLLCQSLVLQQDLHLPHGLAHIVGLGSTVAVIEPEAVDAILNIIG